MVYFVASMFFNAANIFEKKIQIASNIEYIFVADLFVEEYVGGAELTLEALIKTAPGQFVKVKAQEVNEQLIKDNQDKFWIFGNFSTINFNLLPLIIHCCNYSVVECDYKFCKYRSIEKHIATEGKCDCHNTQLGAVVAGFLNASKQLFWMSQAQKNVYENRFEFLQDKKESSVVLSSVFEQTTLQKIKTLRETNSKNKTDTWIILGSNSWVKGFEQAEKYCKDNNLNYETVWNVSYDEMLQKLALAKGLVYLPNGSDTCPRLVCEAKLLGCELILNDFVQHVEEKWFSETIQRNDTFILFAAASTLEISKTETYLSTATSRFWDEINAAMVRQPKISGYVTTYNCVKQAYPFERCINSLLNFCFEVCILDGGSNDGTLEALACLKYPQMKEPLTGSNTPAINLLINDLIAKNFPDVYKNWQVDTRIKIKQIIRDWTSPRFAVFDGLQKAEARKMCVGDYCWQADCDEVFHEDDVKKIYTLCRITHLDIIALPVIEYWGSSNKVRIDVTPWKWRLTKNKPFITHGIPKELRRFDENGELYSAPGSDGCDFVHAQTFERLAFGSFYTQEADEARRQALMGNKQALAQYEQWINSIVQEIPAAYHYSWHDIERKIKLYRDYWQKHWTNLANQSSDDTAANNMFFDLPWSQVTDEMIKERATELATKTGGHIFHTKWNGSVTPFVRCYKKEPK